MNRVRLKRILNCDIVTMAMAETLDDVKEHLREIHGDPNKSKNYIRHIGKIILYGRHR